MRAHAATPAPQPLLIAAAGHTCVAWWHAPASDVEAPPLAVVLASSWGEDDMAGYDGQRALAIALAEAGLAALRFEWPDTGDSSAATGTTSVADALAAFDAAAVQARALSGCGRLVFVGLGLGALLAAQAALARDDVELLVGLMPVASGQAFTSAQRELAAGVPAPTPAPRPGTSFDPAQLPVSLGGFTQSVRGLEALAALRWPATCAPALREALLVAAPDAAVQALVRAGLRASEQASGEGAGLLPATIAGVVRWLRERAGDGADAHGASSPEPIDPGPASFEAVDAVVTAAQLEVATSKVLAQAAAGARTWMRLRANGVAVRERVVRIGDDHPGAPPLLAGVLGERDVPAAGLAAQAPRRGIVLLAADAARRIGPHRLWVGWARQRAARGDVVLRLDLAGIGDSAAHPDPDDAHGSADVARALAWLRREHGVDHVALVGLRSGATHAWQAALAGHDVQQVVAINPSQLRWPAITENNGPRAGVSALAARARRALGWPLDGELAADLGRLGARGVALDFVFSRREPGLASLHAQAGRRGMKRARDGGVTIHEIAHADPTFAGGAARAALHARLDGLLSAVPSS